MARILVEAQDLYVDGNLSSKTFTAPAGAIRNVDVLGNAQIAASKLQQQGTGIWSAIQLFEPATAVASVNRTLGMAYASGTLAEFAAWIEVVATGADRTITVDLQKSTGGGAYATVLSATIGFTNGSAVRTKSVSQNDLPGIEEGRVI